MANRYWVMWGHYPGYTGNQHFWILDDGTSEYRVLQDHHANKNPFRTVPRGAADIETAMRASGAVFTELVEPRTAPGAYHPRIFRPHWCPRARDLYDNEFHSAQGAALNLFHGMQEVFRYVHPAGNLNAFGHEVRQLLILACTEVEAQCKAVLRENHYVRLAKDKVTKQKVPIDERWWNIRDYRKTSRPLLLAGYKVRLRGHPDLPLLHPFAAWAAGSTTDLP